MAHYAFLDENNVVVEVIVGKNENEDGVDWEQKYAEFRGQTCKRTSYNTIGGKHLENGIPFRKNYACIGYLYDSNLDAFVPPKPYESWTLNLETCLWDSPIPYPDDKKNYSWDESQKLWVEVTYGT